MSNKPKVKKIIVESIMTNDEIAKMEGMYFPESHYKHIIKKDCDVWGINKETGKKKLLLRLRKKVIPNKLCRLAVKAFADAAKKKHENRGAAGGHLDRNKLRGYVGDLINSGKFRSGYISSKSGEKSNQLISNLAPSNIVGFYDKPDRNLKGKGAPCRLTAFNRDNADLFKKAQPFIKKVDRMFKKLVPAAYKRQHERAHKTPDFAIGDTCFSTITINYSWRTGLHRDAGDFEGGYGNLVVCEDENNPNKFRGCYLGFPQYGVAVDVREGDFLAMDVHEWHANTEFKPWRKNSRAVKITKGKNGDDKNDIINDWHYNRLSMVFYLREGMLKCKNKKLTRNKDKAKLKTRKTLEK